MEIRGKNHNMIAGDKAGLRCKLKEEKLGVQCFIREQMLLQFRHVKNRINLEKQEQEQDTDMDGTDTDCRGSRAAPTSAVEVTEEPF